MKKLSLGATHFVAALLIVATTPALRADDPAPTPEDLERQAAIEAFTKKQIAADYGPKFKQAAEEFKVPVEILMGLSFSETRHEHLVWPEGERYSSENGMPRPYGIMSLWDNEFFGHSLLDAAKLIGKDPEVLKADAFENMRGAAALLRKYYDENEKPGYAKPDSLESWKYALIKYSALPEPDLAHQHAFDVYDFLTQGYDQYGIKLPEVPDLDLKEMWAETKKIKEEQRKINEEKWRKEGRMDDAILEEYQDPNTGMWTSREVGKKGDTNAVADASPRTRTPVAAKSQTPAAVATSQPTSGNSTLWILIIGATALVLGFLVMRKKPEQPGKK
jgi:hypothetical protein